MEPSVVILVLRYARSRRIKRLECSASDAIKEIARDRHRIDHHEIRGTYHPQVSNKVLPKSVLV